MLIAVTSKDGININQHFGHAERFLIYEVADGTVRLVTEVAAEAYCNWGAIQPEMNQEEFDEAIRQLQECAEATPGHRMMPEKLAAIAAALGDCRIIVTEMIGEAPQAELERLGITTFTLRGRIDLALPELVKVL